MKFVFTLLFERVEAYELPLLNFLLGVAGLLGVWITTHSWYAVGWAFVAALHIRIKINPN